ncbi:helix-turn-helix transcriptional regulator [Algoriphagus confluentis]|uniref:HTH luxR-type domain-containing protein n=1 Tax=Algoriphagus confluentis TaxID=1697556 RepID=A0ABQ6PST2_9BACT|nr:hypothetical protein Aconfl_36440 [Algoriphagus confluentis]
MLSCLYISSAEHDREEILSFLIQLGNEVEYTSDLFGAFEKIDSGSVDLVIVKFFSEKNPILDLFFALKSRMSLRGVYYFLLVPREIRKDQLMVYLEMGFDNLFFYPYNFESIQAKIQNLINRKKNYDWFESEDFHQWIKSSHRPVAFIRKNLISFANEIFLEHLAISNGKLSHPFSELVNFSSNEANEIEISRFFKNLTQSVLLRHVPLSSIKTVDFLLYRGRNSPNHSYLAEVVCQRFNEFEMGFEKYLNSSLKEFTAREKEVLLLSEKGLPMKEIADKLSLSARTVERHRANILKKTNSSNILEAISKVNR